MPVNSSKRVLDADRDLSDTPDRARSWRQCRLCGGARLAACALLDCGRRAGRLRHVLSEPAGRSWRRVRRAPRMRSNQGGLMFPQLTAAIADIATFIRDDDEDP